VGHVDPRRPGGRIDLDGTVTTFPLEPATCRPAQLATGRDGAVWYTRSGDDRIGRIGRSTVGTDIRKIAIESK
jgi:virginiamycin B lyase